MTPKTEKILKIAGITTGIVAVGTGAGVALGSYFKLHPKLHPPLIIGSITIVTIIAILVDNMWRDQQFTSTDKEIK